MEIKYVEIGPDLAEIILIFVDVTIKDLQLLQQGFSAKDYDLMAKACHRILGTAASYGFTQLDELIREVQQQVHGNNFDQMSPLMGDCRQYQEFLEKNYKKN